MKPPYDANDFILEGIMTTLKPGGSTTPLEERVNIAPMGPIVDSSFMQFVFRPFKSSTTYQNLKATGEGVFHVTDDACLIARAAVGKLAPGPDLQVVAAQRVQGLVLAGVCRYYELRVLDLDDSQERTTIRAEAVHKGSLRDFLGFNRARHAVLEAAILATRVHLTGREAVLAQFEKLQGTVDKTGREAEHQAMLELIEFVKQSKKA